MQAFIVLLGSLSFAGEYQARTLREDLIQPVLQTLLDIIEGGKKPNRMLLIQRLEALKNWAEDDDTLELVSTVRAALD